MVTGTCGSVTSTTAILAVKSYRACSLADIVGGGSDGSRPDGIVDGNEVVASVNSFSVGDTTIDALPGIAGSGADVLSGDGIIDGKTSSRSSTRSPRAAKFLLADMHGSLLSNFDVHNGSRARQRVTRIV